MGIFNEGYEKLLLEVVIFENLTGMTLTELNRLLSAGYRIKLITKEEFEKGE